MAWAFVSPASRGIGFYLARHLLQETCLPVVATARKDLAAVEKNILMGLKDIDKERLLVLPLDVTGKESTILKLNLQTLKVTEKLRRNRDWLICPCRDTDEATIYQAANQIQSKFPPSTNHLHFSFCLPGILYPEKSLSQILQANATETFAVNSIGPLLMIKHFSPFLPRKNVSIPPIGESMPSHAIWLNMSARVGSISDNHLGGWYSYRASKAALNSITKSFDLHLQNRSGDNAIAISYHPGTVKTDLSKEFWATVPKGKLFSPEYAVSCIWNIIKRVGLIDRGRCIDWKGEIIQPWGSHNYLILLSKILTKSTPSLNCRCCILG